MKKIFLLLVLTFISYVANCQNDKYALSGFMGIKFGTSKDSVILLMTQKGAKYDIANSDNESLVFTNLSIVGRTPDMVLIKILNNKFFTAAMSFKPNLKSQVFRLYNQIKSELNERFYTTYEDTEEYSGIYSKGDGFEDQAVQMGKATIESYWRFPTDNAEYKNLIKLKITTDCEVYLIYQNTFIASIKNKLQVQEY